LKLLTAYVLDGHNVALRPAPLERDWMDKTRDHFAYRCLPLNIANGYGWEILCPDGLTAWWDGSDAKECVQVEPDTAGHRVAISHFGSGVLTFHIPCIFQTDSGVDLFVTGPVNRLKDGIGALSGIVETDWSPYTFTMNWLFTRRDRKVRFEKGEPFCHVFPIERGAIEAVKPRLRKLSEAPELERAYRDWADGRHSFTEELSEAGSAAQQARWQKNYFRGLMPDGRPTAAGHVNRLRLRPFER
jgi:hypothetical protein